MFAPECRIDGVGHDEPHASSESWGADGFRVSRLRHAARRRPPRHTLLERLAGALSGPAAPDP